MKLNVWFLFAVLAAFMFGHAWLEASPWRPLSDEQLQGLRGSDTFFWECRHKVNCTFTQNNIPCWNDPQAVCGVIPHDRCIVLCSASTQFKICTQTSEEPSICTWITAQVDCGDARKGSCQWFSGGGEPYCRCVGPYPWDGECPPANQCGP
ncbi:MAG: hypothetical protein DWQ01_05295 [Planctomycetota bacterium]|nr:MAG: hypothetical protein DWQ01_05295 [Planctomycetota bacterium]